MTSQEIVEQYENMPVSAEELSANRDPRLYPAPGDRFRRKDNGVVREVYDVVERGGRVIVKFWTARMWTSKHWTRTHADVPTRKKTATVEAFRNWSRVAENLDPVTPRPPKRPSFKMIPAHQLRATA